MAIRRGLRRGPLRRARGLRRRDADGHATPSRSIRWSTGSGSASASWPSGRSSRCCPRRAFAFAMAQGAGRARRRHDAALLLLLAACRRVARAQHVEHARSTAERPMARSRSRSELGARSSACAAAAARKRIGDVHAARMASEMRGEIAKLLDARQDGEQVVSSTSSRSTAARSRSARRSTRASTAWRGCSRIWSARRARLRSRSWRAVVAAASRTRRASAGSPRGSRARVETGR